MNATTIEEVVRRLIGPIMPLGCQASDDKRFESLKLLCSLHDALTVDIVQMAACKDDPRYSVKRAGQYAQQVMDDLRDGLGDD